MKDVAKNGRAALSKVPHFECKFVPPDHELGQVWNFVRLGLDELIKKVRPAGYYTMRPEDVYLELRLGKAALYTAWLDGDLHGFGIVKRIEDIYKNAEPYMLAWLGWCDNREATELYFLDLEKVALSYKLKEIRFYSTRHGWLKAPPGPGWELLSSDGWLKAWYPHDFRLAPEICMRKVVA